MSDSILTSTKKALGIDESYEVFDVDIVMHINSIFSTLSQLGIGPEEGYMIEDSASTWEDYLNDDLKLNSVKSYMYLRVRIIFDPPTTPHLINAVEAQYKELEWRLSTQREGVLWVPPTSVVDGGDAIDGE